MFSQDLTPFKHIPQLVLQIQDTSGVRVLMALPYRPREVWWNLLMKHVQFAVNTSNFRLQMRDGTETKAQFRDLSVCLPAYYRHHGASNEEAKLVINEIGGNTLKRCNPAWKLLGTFLMSNSPLAPFLW